jgi:hypothetical protein
LVDGKTGEGVKEVIFALSSTMEGGYDQFFYLQTNPQSYSYFSL